MLETRSSFSLPESPSASGDGQTDERHEPRFDGGSFTISEFSTSPEGLEVKTVRSLGRTATMDQPLRLTTEQKSTLRVAMEKEMQFNGVDALRAARTAWHDAEDTGDTEEIKRLRRNYFDERNAYINSGKKVGLRNAGVKDGVLEVDTMPVSFPVYRTLSSPENSPEVLELSRLAGVAMIVRTADQRLIVQHRAVEVQRLHEEKRSRGNAAYTDIPGASVAGMLDASLSFEENTDRKPGTLDPVNTEEVLAGIYKEAGEELGLSPDQFEGVRIVGLAHDKIKPHEEILLYAESKLTTAEITKASRESNKNKDLGAADFEEKFFDIEASPEAIATLLTKVRCPLPPTHAAALVAAGHSIVMEQHGLEAANLWSAQLEAGVKANYEAIDSTVTSFYKAFPDALTQVPERFWNEDVPPRNPNGYAPAYSPEEQGLPSFEDAMVESGLMPETREHVEAAWLFDVDGPLSDPTEKRVKHPEIFDEIADRLRRGDVVGLNTGRSVEWVMEQVAEPLKERLGDEAQELMSRMVVIGEKAGTWQDGEHFGKVETLTIPEDLHDDIKKLVDEKYSDVLFIDPTKYTMITAEMIKGYDNPPYEKFRAKRDAFAQEIKRMLAERGEKRFAVDATTIAVDVESPHVGKDVGAERFMQWLKDNNYKVDEFYSFGDSISDLDMDTKLRERGKKATFVYSGSDESMAIAKAEGKIKPGATIVEVGDYSTGTLKYLQSV